ncbi:MAG: hypothetical protein FJ280_01770 [Planctomycetes bacterium]|nr:hypothetical protein [Planctomycetota bacterium]
MSEVVLDAGPVIHLSQLKLFRLLALFPSLHTPLEVRKEITRFDLPGKREFERSEGIHVHRVSGSERRAVEAELKAFRLQKPDISVLALCRKIQAGLLLTDDLELRRAAEVIGLESCGTLGILLRTSKRGWLSLDETRQALRDLFNLSSLYLSAKLLDQVLEALSRQDK